MMIESINQSSRIPRATTSNSDEDVEADVPPLSLASARDAEPLQLDQKTCPLATPAPLPTEHDLEGVSQISVTTSPSYIDFGPAASFGVPKHHLLHVTTHIIPRTMAVSPSANAVAAQSLLACRS
jgi:hypothetical protein